MTSPVAQPFPTFQRRKWLWQVRFEWRLHFRLQSQEQLIRTALRTRDPFQGQSLGRATFCDKKNGGIIGSLDKNAHPTCLFTEQHRGPCISCLYSILKYKCRLAKRRRGLWKWGCTAGSKWCSVTLYVHGWHQNMVPIFSFVKCIEASQSSLASYLSYAPDILWTLGLSMLTHHMSVLFCSFSAPRLVRRKCFAKIQFGTPRVAHFTQRTHTLLMLGYEIRKICRDKKDPKLSNQRDPKYADQTSTIRKKRCRDVWM